jgi:hypothetical protein
MEIMEILEAFDATGCAHSAAQIAGVDPKTVRRYVAAREEGRPVDGVVQRPRIIELFLAKIEEWVDRSDGSVRADVVHERLQGLGFTGDERTTRRAVAEAKAVWRSGNRRQYRPWITEPGLWLQFDWGNGPIVFGPDGRPRPTLLFCAWLAWSRFRVVLPTWDRRLGTLMTCLDTTLRRLGGAQTYALTDNEKTVTVEHVAGVPVRHPMIVAAGRHYGIQVHTCVPFDPESKGGSEATVRIAKADLVPTKANLLSGYNCSPSSARRARCSARRSTAGCIGRPHASRSRRWWWSGPGCIRFRSPRSPPRPGFLVGKLLHRLLRPRGGRAGGYGRGSALCRPRPLGRPAITRAWLILVFPACILSYLGQGALILGDPDNVSSPFFLLVPDWGRLPMVLLATAATVIASQAVITGAYSVASQAAKLGYLPRLRITHTSEETIGQIYVPWINWLLMVSVLTLVFAFQTSSALAYAFGMAVTCTITITTLLFFYVCSSMSSEPSGAPRCGW